MVDNITGTLASIFNPSPVSVLDLNVISQLDIFLNCFLIHLLSLLGVLTNIFNIIVLSKHSFQETTNILLFSLSICDLMCSILQPFRKINCIIEQFNPAFSVTVKSFTRVYLFLLPDLFVCVSILHTTAIAIERLVAVCFPLHVSRIFTPSRVKWTVLFIYIYATGMLFPAFLIFDFRWAHDARYNDTVGSIALSHLYLENFDTLNTYSGVATAHMFITSPFCVIIVCSAVTALRMTFGRGRVVVTSSSSASRQVKELRVVKMLLTVCAVNAAIALPSLVLQMFLMYSNYLILASNSFLYLLRCVINAVYQLNVTINFVIYMSMSSKFAATLRQTLCHGKDRKRTKKSNLALSTCLTRQQC